MPKIIYTRFVPFGAAGFTFTPWFILIKKRDYEPWRLEGLLNHELKHVEQMKRDGLIRWWLRYIFSPKGRAKIEAEAYVENIRARAAFGPASWEVIRDFYADHIWFHYYPLPFFRLGRPKKWQIAAYITEYAEPYLYTQDPPRQITLNDNELP